MNKRNLKWLLMTLVLLLFVVPATAATAAAPSAAGGVKSVAYELSFDGKTLKLPEGQYLFIKDGVSYVPVRFISYALQQSVTWDSKNAKVTVAKPSAIQLTALKEYLTNAIAPAGTPAAKGNVALKLQASSASFVFDGVVKKLPANQTAYLLGGSLYVPVRFMSESTGSVMKWDSANHRISGESESFRNTANTGNNGDGETTGSTNNGGGNGPTTGTPGGAVGGSGGVVSYEALVADADAKIQSLYNSAKSNLMSLGLSYIAAQKANDKAEMQKLYAEGDSYMTEITSQFNAILADLKSKLVANNYSTAIISEYQAKFNEEKAAGMALLKSLN
ncbi:copper amine oxidase N-terminal domain-containing protein [Paenibacillus kobensis]|uniref:copper amine oxidase N-terminal domain-containing protein n=1 Tax=Paenibacillus kobensis TaxID=59841 RepID=UPI000FDBF929|nr:copper amine oxidase N-terminal domain-containing protein [Paenibacillus kobensis]